MISIPFERNVCACYECVLNCKTIPGFLIPEDLEAMAAGHDVFEYARENLLASPGAIAVKNGQAFRLPTLVPARKPDLSCINLDQHDRCSVHDRSPAGCRFFSEHMDQQEGADRSQYLLAIIYQTWHGPDAAREAWDGDPAATYRAVWSYLDKLGLRASSPQENRNRRARLLYEHTKEQLQRSPM